MRICAARERWELIHGVSPITIAFCLQKNPRFAFLYGLQARNQKIETAELDNEDAHVKEQPVYSGDDMGVLLV